MRSKAAWPLTSVGGRSLGRVGLEPTTNALKELFLPIVDLSLYGRDTYEALFRLFFACKCDIESVTIL